MNDDVDNEGQRALRGMNDALEKLAKVPVAGPKTLPAAQVEIARLNALLAAADEKMLRGIQQARTTLVPAHANNLAFMLMTYRSEGGAFELKVWNSRDGVTPFQIHVDGMQYTHAISEAKGPYYDRPEGCVAQWETRTEAGMMAAWHRTLERAVLAGRMTKERASSMADDPNAARANHLDIGLRSMATGKYTDEK